MKVVWARSCYFSEEVPYDWRVNNPLHPVDLSISLLWQDITLSLGVEVITLSNSCGKSRTALSLSRSVFVRADTELVL